MDGKAFTLPGCYAGPKRKVHCGRLEAGCVGSPFAQLHDLAFADLPAKYCAFATHQAHVHPLGEVERMLDEAVKRRARELLFLTGEKPEVNPAVKEQLRPGAR